MMSGSQRHVWMATWLLVGLVTGLATASRHRNKHRDDDDDDDDAKDVFWEKISGIVVIGIISVVGAALFSLCAWIVCSCHERCNKRSRVNSTGLLTIQPGKGRNSTTHPEWSRRLTINPELGVGFGQISEGFYSLSTVQLLRQRPGPDVTDGARWAAPLNAGKHMFEIIWPWGCRGYEATVGVATRDAPLKVKGKASLVGGNAHSWGLDIVRRRVLHNGRSLATCPTDGSYVPDKFLMYVDVDEGTVGFGSDVTFWGNVITGIPRGKPLFPMVGSNKWEANIQVFYRGTADVSGFDPYSGLGESYALPPLTGPLPPTYNDIFTVSSSGKGRPESAGLGGKPSSPAGSSPRLAWSPEPPPTPTAPGDLPPAYFSPVPPVD